MGSVEHPLQGTPGPGAKRTTSPEPLQNGLPVERPDDHGDTGLQSQVVEPLRQEVSPVSQEEMQQVLGEVGDDVPMSPEQSGPTGGGELLTAWQQLPAEQQVAVTLGLLGALMDSEQEPAIREAIASRWPIATSLLATAFPVVDITRDDLIEAGFHQDEIGYITDADLLTIARTMRDHAVHDAFWPELEYTTAALLEEKRQRSFREILEETSAADGPFYRWMAAVDRHVWTLAGCSIYDLPDYDFRSMFDDDVVPAESVNRVLEEAGFDLENWSFPLPA